MHFSKIMARAAQISMAVESVGVTLSGARRVIVNDRVDVHVSSDRQLGARFSQTPVVARNPQGTLEFVRQFLNRVTAESPEKQDERDLFKQLSAFQDRIDDDLYDLERLGLFQDYDLIGLWIEDLFEILSTVNDLLTNGLYRTRSDAGYRFRMEVDGLLEDDIAELFSTVFDRLKLYSPKTVDERTALGFNLDRLIELIEEISTSSENQAFIEWSNDFLDKTVAPNQNEVRLFLIE